MKRKIITVFIALSILLHSVFISSTCMAVSQSSINWTKNMQYAIDEFKGIAYGNGMYIAVGVDGIIRTSTDAVKWERVNSGIKDDIEDVIWANNKFTAVSKNGNVLDSSNGVKWLIHNMDKESYPKKIYYYNGKYIVLSGGYCYYTSTNGVKWETIKTTAILNSVTWNGKSYFATDFDYKSGRVLVSSDGDKWEEVFSVNKEIKEIMFANNMYVAVGEDKYRGFIITSSDGVTWNMTYERDERMEINGIIWDGSRFVAFGDDGLVLQSNNGDNWDDKSLKDGEYPEKMIFINGKYILIDILGQIQVSQDLSNWTITVKNPYIGYNAVIWDGQKFIIVGEQGTMLTSSDSLKWTNIETGNQESLKGIVYNGKKYVVTIWKYDDSLLEIMSSLDGVKWKKSSFKSNDYPGNIIWDGKHFIMVADNGKIFTSVDGDNWLTNNIGDSCWLQDIEWNGKTYIAVGTSASIYSSNDGENWTNRYKGPEGACLNDVTWNGKEFIAIGDYGPLIFTSPNGEKWTNRGPGDNSGLNKVVWDGKRYISVGFGGSIQSYEGSKTWCNLKSCTSNSLNGIAWNGKSYVVVGDSSTILISEPSDIIKVVVNGKPVICNIAPMEKDGEFLAAGNELFNTLGIKMEYNKKTKTYTFIKGKVAIKMTVNSKESIVNGKKVKMRVPVTATNGYNYIPIKFICDSLGISFKVDKSSNIVNITNK